jgi:hypothetical protein
MNGKVNGISQPGQITVVSTGTFYKTCPNGYVADAGTPFAKSYHSLISFEDAQSQSDADFDTAGQANANSVGYCILPPLNQTVQITVNNYLYNYQEDTIPNSDYNQGVSNYVYVVVNGAAYPNGAYNTYQRTCYTGTYIYELDINTAWDISIVLVNYEETTSPKTVTLNGIQLFTGKTDLGSSSTYLSYSGDPNIYRYLVPPMNITQQTSLVFDLTEDTDLGIPILVQSDLNYPVWTSFNQIDGVYIINPTTGDTIYDFNFTTDFRSNLNAAFNFSLNSINSPLCDLYAHRSGSDILIAQSYFPSGLTSGVIQFEAGDVVILKPSFGNPDNYNIKVIDQRSVYTSPLMVYIQSFPQFQFLSNPGETHYANTPGNGQPESAAIYCFSEDTVFDTENANAFQLVTDGVYTHYPNGDGIASYVTTGSRIVYIQDNPSP